MGKPTLREQLDAADKRIAELEAENRSTYQKLQDSRELVKSRTKTITVLQDDIQRDREYHMELVRQKAFLRGQLDILLRLQFPNEPDAGSDYSDIAKTTLGPEVCSDPFAPPLPKNY